LSFLPKEELVKEYELEWRNAKVNLQFLKDRLIVHLFANNVCVDRMQISRSAIKCPNPECKYDDMKCIVNEPIAGCRVQQRFICRCGAYVQLEWDTCEE
jgi:hypothetical protein